MVTKSLLVRLLKKKPQAYTLNCLKIKFAKRRIVILLVRNEAVRKGKRYMQLAYNYKYLPSIPLG